MSSLNSTSCLSNANTEKVDTVVDTSPSTSILNNSVDNNPIDLLVATDAEYDSMIEICNGGNVTLLKTFFDIYDCSSIVNKIHEYQQSLLQYACINGHANIVTLLLDKGADINLQDHFGYTPLMYSCLNSHEHISKELLDRGANFHICSIFDGTALILASFVGLEHIVIQLLEKGADVNIQDADHRTALMDASCHGYTNIVKLLLEKGADINVQDVLKGNTSLIWASYKGYIDIVKILVEYGADINIKNCMNQTAYDKAKDNEIKLYLRQETAKQTSCVLK